MDLYICLDGVAYTLRTWREAYVLSLWLLSDLAVAFVLN